MKKIITHSTEQKNNAWLFSLARALFALVLTIQSFSVCAQTYPVQVQPTINFPSAFLSDYNDPSNLNVRVYLSDITKVDYKIKLRVFITGPDFQATTALNQELLLTLQGGQVYFLNDSELGELFRLSNLAIEKGAVGGPDNSLPEGVYTLSFQAYDATIPGNLVVSNRATDFTAFSVNRYDPPMLTSPANKQVFEVMLINQNIFFSWTPRHIIFSPKQQVKYRFRMVKVLPVDRNPYDAINVSDPAVIDQEDLDFPVFIYTPADLQLEEGAVYAWQVTAYEEVTNAANQIVRSSSRFKNVGQSEVFSFSIKENCQPFTPFKAPKVTKNLVALQWNFDPSHVEYELAYRPFGTSLPWSPITTADNLYNLDNTVLQPGVTYEYTVRAKCKNWMEPAYGGTFMMAVPTCAPPDPVTVDNSVSTKTTLTWAPVTGATSYRVQYKDLANPSAAFTDVSVENGETSYDLTKLTSGGYRVKVDAVCDAETAEGKANDISFDETGVVGPCPIPAPFQLVATRVTGDFADLSWTPSTAHTGYSLTYWHRDSSTVKRTLTSTEPKVRAGFIKDDQLYNYQITFTCGTKSTTSPIGMFRVEGNAGPVVIDPTTANCFPPAVLQAEPRSTTSALFEWSKVDGVDEYQLFYAVKDSKQFKPFNTISSSATIKDLVDSEKYQYMVRSRCGGKYSIFSDTALVDLAGGKSNANCDSAAYFITKGQTKTEIRLYWPTKTADTGYKLTFREASQSPSDEYIQTFSDIVAFKNDHLLNDTLRYTFENLKPGTAYVFRLQVLCGTNEALKNAPLKVSTVAEVATTGACGSTPSCDKSVVTPLTSLAAGDSIYCADYGVLVDQVTSSNTVTGTYSGSGFMNMPFPGVSDFVRMSVSFKDVKINAKPNSCIYEGIINIDSVNASAVPIDVRNKIKAAEEQIASTIAQAQDALAAAQDGIDQAQDALQNAIDYFQGGDNVGSVHDGGLGGATTTQTLSTSTKATVNGATATVGGTTVPVPGLIRDATGNVFQVGPDGNLTHVGQYDNNLNLVQDTTLDLSAGQIVFKENSSAVYDFDEWKSQYSGKIQVERKYELIGTNYRVPAKLILPGELDKVNASLVGGSYDKSKIKFANGKGMVYDHTLSGSTFTLNVAGGPAADGQYIYAWYVNGTTKKAIGKLLVPSYAPQEKKVVVVPIGKAVTRIDASKIQATLNEVYGKLGISYTVSVDDSFKNNLDWDEGHAKGQGDGMLVPSGSKLTSNDYKGEEAAMINTYVSFKGGESNIDPNTAYFFALYEAPLSDDGLIGKMPATAQFGFLFLGAATEALAARTVAHELGHGAYHLEHTFHNIYLGKNSQGNTTNLMDYNNDGSAKDLWKFQWDIIHDPGHVWSILKKDADAQARAMPVEKRRIEFCKLVEKLPAEGLIGLSATIPQMQDCDNFAKDANTEITEMKYWYKSNGAISTVNDIAILTMKYYVYKLYCAGITVNLQQYSSNFPKTPVNMDPATYTIHYSAAREFEVVTNPASVESANNYSGIGKYILNKNQYELEIVCAVISVCKQIAMDNNLLKASGSAPLFAPHKCWDLTRKPKPMAQPEVFLTESTTLSEFDAGTTMITATLSYAVPVPVVVSLDISGTATLDKDYTCGKTITIPANQTSASIPFTVLRDTEYEEDEIAVIQTWAATNATIHNTVQEVEITIKNYYRTTLAVTKNVRTYIAHTTGNITVKWNYEGDPGVINEFKYKSTKGTTYIIKTPTCVNGECTVNFGNQRLGSEIEYQIVTKNKPEEAPTPIIAVTANFQGRDYLKTLCDQEKGSIGDKNAVQDGYTFQWSIDNGNLPKEFADKQEEGITIKDPYPYVEFNYNGTHTYTLKRTHTTLNTPVVGGIIDYAYVLIDPLMDCTWRIIAKDYNPPSGSGPREAFNNQVLQVVESDASPIGQDAYVTLDDPSPKNIYGENYPKWSFDGTYNKAFDNKVNYDVINNSYPSPSNASPDNTGIIPMHNDYQIDALNKSEAVKIEYFRENKTPLNSFDEVNDPVLDRYRNFFKLCEVLDTIQGIIDYAIVTMGGTKGFYTLPITCDPIFKIDKYNAEMFNDPRVVVDQKGMVTANFNGDATVPVPGIGVDISLSTIPIKMNYDQQVRKARSTTVSIPDVVWKGSIQRCYGVNVDIGIAPAVVNITYQVCGTMNMTYTFTSNTGDPNCLMQLKVGSSSVVFAPVATGVPDWVIKKLTWTIPAVGNWFNICVVNK